MDNSANASADSGDDAAPLRWAPPVALVVLSWVAAAAAAFWCVSGATDPAGRVLAGAAVLVLASAALFGSRARPRLTADPAGLAVRGLGAPTRFAWAQVRRVRLVHIRRFGRQVATLEIETRLPGEADDRLLVFGWLDLGTDPRDVAEALDRLRRQLPGT